MAQSNDDDVQFSPLSRKTNKWGDKDGSYGQRVGERVYLGKADADGSMYRALTPKEAQKGRAAVDAQDDSERADDMVKKYDTLKKSAAKPAGAKAPISKSTSKR